MTIALVERIYPSDPSDLVPSITPDNEPYWSGLSRGELLVQGCIDCKRLRFPMMPVCPKCGSTESDWQPLSGKGQVFSWVRYQRSFLQEFADLMPYVVITAELDKGVRIVGRLIDKDVTPEIGAPVWMMRELWPNGRHVPVFSLKEKI